MRYMEYTEKVVSGPKFHDLKDVVVQWRADGSVFIRFGGQGPIEVTDKRMGNYRRAGFGVRRRQL